MKPVVVTGHAIRRAITRRQYPGCGEQRIRDHIRDEVHAAIAAGRCTATVPPWAQLLSPRELRGKRPRPMQLPKGQRFVWTEDEQLCWIIVRETDSDVVVTALRRVRSGSLAA